MFENITKSVILINMIFFVLFFAFAPFSAFAYLDPGTASMIVHVIVGGIVGIVYAIRVFWSNLKNFFRRLLGFKNNEETSEGNS